MNEQVEDTDLKETIERLKQKYLDTERKLRPSEHVSKGSQGQRLFTAQRSKPTNEELECYTDALKELFKAATARSHQSGYEESLSSDSTAAAVPDSQVLFTETDVTLPSFVDGSAASPETERSRESPRLCRFSGSRVSTSFSLANVHQQMLVIYEQLLEERRSQQQWERELCEREKKLKEQEQALGRLCSPEEKAQTQLTAQEERHQQELSRLRTALREKNKENKRLKSSFDTIKELNDGFKKQLIEIIEQNKKLERQSQRVQARLQNLQRKYELSKVSTGCQKESVKSSECIQSSRKHKETVPRKPKEKSSSGPSSQRLLGLLLDWVLDLEKGAGLCSHSEASLTERFMKMLPLLPDLFHRTPSTDHDLHLKLLRLTYWALRHLGTNTPQVVLSATPRRIGDEVLRSAPQSSPVQVKGLDLMEAPEPFISSPLFQSPCPETRLLSTLIILCTIRKADVLAQALISLRAELVSEDSRGLFLHHGGVHVLLSLLRLGRAGLRTPLDILMQLTEPSRCLTLFLEACSCEEFFKMASKLLTDPRVEVALLEKLSILLQKLSTIRRNRRLFESSSINLQIQELHHKTDPKQTFLLLNLRSILHNLQ